MTCPLTRPMWAFLVLDRGSDRDDGKGRCNEPNRAPHRTRRGRRGREVQSDEKGRSRRTVGCEHRFSEGPMSLQHAVISSTCPQTQARLDCARRSVVLVRCCVLSLFIYSLLQPTSNVSDDFADIPHIDWYFGSLYKTKNSLRVRPCLIAHVLAACRRLPRADACPQAGRSDLHPISTRLLVGWCSPAGRASQR